MSEVRIRPMTLEDVAGADAVARDVLFERRDDVDEEVVARRTRRPRVAHLVETDSGGAWVAEDGDGRIVGLSLALLREGIWGYSLFAVAGAHQGRGVGRELFARSWEYGATARAHIILSSTDPAAMRTYALTGLPLLPTISAAGIVDRSRIPDFSGVEEAGEGGIPVADAIGRAVRGAGHGRDLHVPLRAGARLLVFEDRGFALLADGSVRLLAARDEPAAERVLWSAFAATAPGATISVDFLTSGQDWAVRTCLAAGLALSPDGPVFAGGDLGPLRPYVPSGAYL